MEYPFSFQSYESRSLPFSAQRLVNMFYELGVPGTKSQGILYNRPGKTLFATVGSGPHRGTETMKGLPFVVSGQEVYTVDAAGVSTLLGALAGTDIVNMANNGSQVAIVAGTDGYIAVPFLERTTALTVAGSASDVVITVASRTGVKVDDNITITLDSGTDVTTVVALEGDTDLTVGAVSTDTVLTVTSEAGMTVADSISIALDSGGTHTTTIASLGPLTINDQMPSAAAIGSIVTFSNSGTIKLTVALTGAATIGNAVVTSEPTLRQITDSNFPDVSSVTYQDNFFIWSVAETGQIQLSPLLDGLGPYDPLDVATAETAPDNLVAVFADHDDLFLMGEDTIEPWYNSGDVDTPFIPRGGTVMEVGLVARDSVVKLDNSIFWLGNAGERGGLTVWRASGYTPTRVSTHALETKWEKEGDVSGSHGFSFRLEGHDFYALTIPTLGTFVYDASTNLWCEWEENGKTGFDAIGFTDSYNKKLVGSGTDGKMFDLSVDVYTDNGEEVIREATSPPLSTESNNRARHNFARIDLETGVGLTTGQGIDPIISICWANEDGVSFGNWKEMSMGRLGKRKLRAYLRRLGIARSRTYKIRMSDPVKTAVLGAYADLEEGTS